MHPDHQNPRSDTSLYCNWFGHRLRLHRKVTLHFEEYQCKTCKKQFTRDLHGKIVTLTPLLRDVNDTIAHLYQRRNQYRANL